MNKISPRQLQFVEFYVQGLSGAEAARRAGYSAKNAAQTANELLSRNQSVIEAVADARKLSQGKAKYNYEQAMAEADRCIEFAERTENANAMVKAVEHKAKLTGLLVERHDVRQIGFSIHISGIDAPRLPAGGGEMKTSIESGDPLQQISEGDHNE